MKRSLAALFLALSSAFAGGVSAQAASEFDAARSTAVTAARPTETLMRLAGSTNVDLRSLPRVAPARHDTAKPADPEFSPRELPGAAAGGTANALPAVGAAAPAPTITFDGLDFTN